MSRIKIFTDSTSDLTPSWIQTYDVGIIPLYVVFGEESLKDGVEIKPEQLYERVSRDGRLPKTAAPSPADFMTAFQPYIDQGTIFCTSAYPPNFHLHIKMHSSPAPNSREAEFLLWIP